MSKFDNRRSGNYDWPFATYYCVQQFLYNYHPFFEEFAKRVAEKERKEIMNEKFGDNYNVLVSGGFETMGKLIEEKIKEAREKNAIKNSVFFNTDYEKVEEALKNAFADPEFTKRFLENMKSLFTPTGRSKTNMFGESTWKVKGGAVNEKLKKDRKEDGPRLIFEYIRKKKRGIVGVLVGFKPLESSSFYVGYSLCNPKDEFDLFTAFQLAFHSMFRIQTLKNTPQSIKGQKRAFVDRCSAYFKSLSGNFLYVTHKDKFWVDFCACIPYEVRKNMEAGYLDYKHFVLTPKKKELPENNVMYANRVDFENVFDEETYHLDRKKKEFIYKNIRFGGCTNEKPNGRSIKITWEFVD